MAYVYRHIRLDKNVPFYIGIGSDNKGEYSRANNTYHRSEWWKKTAANGYEIEIMVDGISLETAKLKEIEFIELYGRKNLGLGTLVNLTNGGDGLIGYIHTPEHKDKVSKALVGHPVTAETREKLSAILTIKMKGLRSKTLSERHNISKSKTGDKNPMFGKKGKSAPFFKGMVLAFKEGELIGEFEGIYDCAEKLGVCYKKVSACVNGKRNKHAGYTFKRIQK